MKKIAFSAVLLMLLVLNACNDSLIKNSNVVSSDADYPPTVFLEISGESYETVLGSYCWEGIKNKASLCVDTIGPNDLVKDKKPLQVKASEKVVFKVGGTPKSDSAQLIQISNGEHKEASLIKDYFIAPTQAGNYLYSYQLWWMDPEATDISRGDVSYVFAIDVQ